MPREFHLADVLTLGNAACGLAGVFFAMQYMSSRSPAHFFAAAAWAPAALLFDWFDGRVARWRHQQSLLGRELDSLADIISFGVAPAALGFAAGLRGGWDWIALTYFVCCGVSRLARYNVTAERGTAESIGSPVGPVNWLDKAGVALTATRSTSSSSRAHVAWRQRSGNLIDIPTAAAGFHSPRTRVSSRAIPSSMARR